MLGVSHGILLWEMNSMLFYFNIKCRFTLDAIITAPTIFRKVLPRIIGKTYHPRAFVILQSQWVFGH
jgi:hypothetical protein